MTNQTIISVKGVKKAFGAVQALKGVALELQSGKVRGLLGPNGHERRHLAVNLYRRAV
jgi:branched-chain amino acid transport system ATP-binding protein